MTFMLLKKSGFNNIKIPYSNLHSSKVAGAYPHIQMHEKHLQICICSVNLNKYKWFILFIKNLPKT